MDDTSGGQAGYLSGRKEARAKEKREKKRPWRSRGDPVTTEPQQALWHCRADPSAEGRGGMPCSSVQGTSILARGAWEAEFPSTRPTRRAMETNSFRAVPTSLPSLPVSGRALGNFTHHLVAHSDTLSHFSSVWRDPVDTRGRGSFMAGRGCDVLKNGDLLPGFQPAAGPKCGGWRLDKTRS